MVIAPSGSDS